MVSRVNLRLLMGLLVLVALATPAAAQSRRPAATREPALVAARRLRQPPPPPPTATPDDSLFPEEPSPTEMPSDEVPESLGDEEQAVGDEVLADENLADESGEPAADDADASGGEEVVEELVDEEWSEAEEIAPGLLEGEFLHGTGTCGEEGCPHCRNWYSRLDFTLYHRNRPREEELVRTSALVTNPITGAVTLVEFGTLGTKAVAFSLSPGARITVGRYLGRDAQNRDHMLEASYMGFTNWSKATQQQFGRQRTQTTVTDPLTGNSDVYRFVGTTAFTDFPGNANRGFDAADQYIYESSSSLHDLQFNRRIRRGLRRNRLVYMPGGWTQQSTPGLTPSILGGLRFIQIHENAAFRARGRIDNPEVFIGNDVNNNPVFAPFGVGGDFTGDYTTATHNHLFGAQVGGDLTQQFDRWNYGFLLRLGLFSNFATSDGLILVDDPVTFRQTQAPVDNIAFGDSSRSLAFLGEIGFQWSYNLNRYMTFRAGYNLMWVTGLALAPEQMTFASEGFATTTINRGGRTTFQGGNFGLEIVF